jgi:hypothetical protein
MRKLDNCLCKLLDWACKTERRKRIFADLYIGTVAVVFVIVILAIIAMVSGGDKHLM